MRIILEMIFVCFLLIFFFVKIVFIWKLSSSGLSGPVLKFSHLSVLAVLDFQIPSRLETPGFYFRSLLTKHEGYGRELEGSPWLLGRERGTLGRRVRRGPEPLVRCFIISEHRLRFQSTSAHLWSEFCIWIVGSHGFYMITYDFIYSLFWWKDLV